MNRVAAYRQAKLERRAQAAGCTVDEILRRDDAEAERNRQVYALIHSRALQRQAIARHAAICGRCFAIHGDFNV